MYNSLDLEAIVTKKEKIPPEKYEINRDWLDTKMVYLDRQVGRLFEYLKDIGVYDDSYIILLSDHGDLFGEHYSFGHSMELYNELIHAPLIIKYPKNMNRKGINNQFVQTVDLMPELLKELQLPIPEQVQGQPFDQISHELVSELFRRNDLTLNKPRYNRDLKAIYDTNTSGNSIYKFIQSTNGQHELYNLDIDPTEKKNILSVEQRIANILDERLNRWRMSIIPMNRGIGDPHQLDKTTKDRLKALGYIK